MQIRKIKITMPWKNLGCFGVEKKGAFYFDIFVRPYFGLYFHDHKVGTRRWFKLPTFRLLKGEYLDAEGQTRRMRTR